MPKVKRASNYFPHEKHHYKILILIGLVGLWLILELLGFGVFNRSSQNNSINPAPLFTSGTKYTASSIMGGFTIEVPEGFEVEEKPPTVILHHQEGDIVINKSNTNFTSLESYLADLIAQNNLIPEQNTRLNIDNFEASMQMLKTPSGSRVKVFKIYINGNVYSLSAENNNLYVNLDQIAHSFRVPKE